MSFKFSQRSLDRLKGVHPDIVAVLNLALKRTPIDFTVLEGLRSLERQKQLVRRGSSKTLNSRHLTGHAVDIAPIDSDGEVSWDWPLYHKLAPVVKQAAEELGVDLEWGGDWRTFKDGPHWQLAWDTHPKGDMTPKAKALPVDVGIFTPEPTPTPTTNHAAAIKKLEEALAILKA